MTKSHLSDFAGAMHEAVDRSLAAMDMLVRELNLPRGSPVAVALEAQREIILSLGRLSELVAEVGESQSDILASPEMKAALERGARMGADAGFKEVASAMRRRAFLNGCILAAGMAMLGGIAGAAGFTEGSKHELRTLVADCLRHETPLAPDGERICAVLMTSR